MGKEKEEDPYEGVDWKAVGREWQANPGVQPDITHRLKRRRQIPEYYFLPRRSFTYNFFFFGGCIAAGIGTGMLIEKWIEKKVKEDGGIIWEFDK